MSKTQLLRTLFIATSVVLVGALCATPVDAVPQRPSLAPSFWDPGLRLERPGLSGVRAIRFLTDDDYPPLNFAGEDGALAGFNVEIARAICEELEIACTIQARRWDTLIDSLQAGKGDAVIASIAATGATRARIDFSQPYYQTPARFVVRRDAALSAANVSALKMAIGVIAGSSHEAYLKAFFPRAVPKPFADRAALQAALRAGEIDAALVDGLTFAVWLNGNASADCCAFLPGAYCESRYFGEGVGIAVRKGDGDLRQALDWALARLAARGVYSEIYLKSFPIGFY